MKIYIICPVRKMTEEERKFLRRYVDELEREGHDVHYPLDDVDQTDDGIGYNICAEHRAAMQIANRVDIYWNPTSTGSHFDFGMAFALRKPILLIEPPERTPHKSYGNVLLQLEQNRIEDEKEN